MDSSTKTIFKSGCLTDQSASWKSTKSTIANWEGTMGSSKTLASEPTKQPKLMEAASDVEHSATIF